MIPRSSKANAMQREAFPVSPALALASTLDLLVGQPHEAKRLAELAELHAPDVWLRAIDVLLGFMDNRPGDRANEAIPLARQGFDLARTIHEGDHQ